MKKLLYLLLFVCVSATAQIKVAVPFVKNNPADNSIMGYTNYIAGAPKNVPNYHGRDSLTVQYSATLQWGMTCYVQNVDSTYRWSGVAWLPLIKAVNYTFGNGIIAPGNVIQIDTTTFFPVRGTNITRTSLLTTIPTIAPAGFYSTSLASFQTLVPGFTATTTDAVNFINTRHGNTVNNKGWYLVNTIDDPNLYFIPYNTGVQSIYKMWSSANLSFGSGLNLSGNVLTATGTGITALTGDVTASGSGSVVATVANGVIGIAKLSATGTPSSTTYLRGDNTWAAAASPVTFAIRETPSGIINSSNTTYTLAHTPTTGTECVYRNGQLQVLSADYTISGGTITYLYAPTTGDVLRVNYNY